MEKYEIVYRCGDEHERSRKYPVGQASYPLTLHCLETGCRKLAQAITNDLDHTGIHAIAQRMKQRGN